nr:serine hydrolase domain-containing protein [Hyphomonas sp. Mor2]
MIKTPVRSFLLASLAFGALSACATSDIVTEPVIVDTPPVTDAAPESVLPEAPAEQGFSVERIEALETAMGDFVRDGRVYGIHSRLAQKGEIVSDYYAGVRGLESGAPIEQDTIYRIYSMTKPITGVAMMMLWEEGKFELSDPVTKYVPEFENLKVLAGVNEDGSPILADMARPPTMSELMSHSSGFAYGLGGDDPVNTAFRDLEVLASPDLQTFIDRTASIPLLFQPGEAWFYSVGMDIQGHIIEKLSGQTFGEFLQTRLFGPLGMVDTGFYVPDADYDRFSEVYGFDPETGALVPVPFPWVQFRQETIGFESGGGGLVSTMDDYSRFAQMLVNRGELDGARILKPETIDVITTNVMPEGASMYFGTDPVPGIGMGLTFGTVEDSEIASTDTPSGSYFWGGAAGTWFWIDPENELYFIGMVQIFDNNSPSGPLQLREASTAAIYGDLAAE